MFWGKPSRKYKIAIIDDEREIVEVLTKFLEARKYEVCSAYGGRSGLDVVRSENPDLILLDIMMPELNGWDVAAELKKNPEWRDIPIVFLTGVTDSTSKTYGKIVSAEYIEKPFIIEDLKKKIDIVSRR